MESKDYNCIDKIFQYVSYEKTKDKFEAYKVMGSLISSMPFIFNYIVNPMINRIYTTQAI